MGTNNVVFLEVLEWFDDTGKQLVQRIPEEGSGEIKFGAQLTVRESQAGVFFYKGKAVEAFGPGRHTLKTANIPIWTAQDLGIEEEKVGVSGSPTRVVQIFSPKREHQSQMLEGDPTTQVAQLIDKLGHSNII